MSTTGRNDHGISQIISHEAIPQAPRLSAPQAVVPTADAGGPGESPGPLGPTPADAPGLRRRSPWTGAASSIAPTDDVVAGHSSRTGTSPGSRHRRRPGTATAGRLGLIGGGTRTVAAASPPAVPGAILGSLPVGSPFGSAGPQQITGLAGPAGYIPQQIQTAYGLSTGSGYNNDISFGAIKGDGTGQTIGIYEEGYNPAFVDTSGLQLQHECAGGLRQDLRPARPAQPDLR